MKTKLALVGGSLLAAAPLFAAGEPLDISSASTTIAGYVPAAAAGGLVIAVAIMGARIIWKMFSGVGKKG